VSTSGDDDGPKRIRYVPREGCRVCRSTSNGNVHWGGWSGGLGEMRKGENEPG